jgi:3-oxo-5-alpha-steroid 4-dehydrogenase 1
MAESTIYGGLLITWVVLAAISFFALLFITAPYGRHGRGGWGPTVDRRLGWLIMESPPVLVVALCFAIGDRRTDPVALTFFALWMLHYLHRDLVFPVRMGGVHRRMPWAVVGMAIVFNAGNGYLQGRWLFALSDPYPSWWLTDARFLVGVAMFVAGFAINLHSDEILRRLRRPGDDGYRIPHGGLYRWVSCPNYLGEILEWTGWAVLTWSLPGAVFALWTAANLVPRALSHHRWYRETFPDYPPSRRALIPRVF